MLYYPPAVPSVASAPYYDCGQSPGSGGSSTGNRSCGNGPVMVEAVVIVSAACFLKYGLILADDSNGGDISPVIIAAGVALGRAAAGHYSPRFPR